MQKKTYKFEIGDRIRNIHGAEGVIVASHPSYGKWEGSKWAKDYYFVMFTDSPGFHWGGLTSCLCITNMELDFEKIK